MSEAKDPVGFGVLKIHAQCGASFADTAIGVAPVAKDQGEAIVALRKARLSFFGGTVFVEGVVPIALFLFQIPTCKVQGTIMRIVFKQRSHQVAGFFILFLLHERRGLNQGCWATPVTMRLFRML